MDRNSSHTPDDPYRGRWIWATAWSLWVLGGMCSCNVACQSYRLISVPLLWPLLVVSQRSSGDAEAIATVQLNALLGFAADPLLTR